MEKLDQLLCSVIPGCSAWFRILKNMPIPGFIFGDWDRSLNIPGTMSLRKAGVKILLVQFCLTFTLFTGTGLLPVPAQDLPDAVLNLLGSVDDEEEIGELIEFFEEMINNPVNVNTATFDQLMMIPGMRSAHAEALLAYRSGNGSFDTEEELLKVRGIGPSSLEQMIPFITVGGYGGRLRRDLTNPRWWVRNGRLETYTRVRQNLETASGYIQPADSVPAHYLGSPLHFTQRITYSSRVLSLNATQIKDPGEQRITYTTAHVAIRDIGPVRMLVAGDYRISSGYGLIFSSGAGMGRVSANSGWSPARNNVILHRTGRYQPVQRGIALSIGNRFNLTLFTANNELSAAVENAAIPDDFENDPGSGYEADLTMPPGPSGQSYDSDRISHSQSENVSIRYPQRGLPARTVLELSRQMNVTEQLRGVRGGLQAGPFTLGAVWYEHRFSEFIVPGSGLHNRYDFFGTSNSAAGADLTFRLNEIMMFSEAGVSRNGGKAWLGGIQYRKGRDGYFRGLYRKYDEKFQSYYGRAVSASSGRPRNEEGFFAGAGGRLAGLFLIDSFIDFYKNPGPRFGISTSSAGHERYIGVQAPFHKAWSLTAAAHYRVRQNGITLEDDYGRQRRGSANESRSRYYIALDGTDDILRYRSRLEWVRTMSTAGEHENGFALMQDVRWSPVHWLRLDARITLFETGSFSSRLYFFEQDVLYSMSLPALYGTGSRSYLLARFRPVRHIELWARIAVIRYDDRPAVGSGHDQTAGNSRTTFSGVLRIDLR
jgi:competence ComEA-like helix-hairpin-helix protein